jgi:hypothetical protein
MVLKEQRDIPVQLGILVIQDPQEAVDRKEQQDQPDTRVQQDTPDLQDQLEDWQQVFHIRM